MTVLQGNGGIYSDDFTTNQITGEGGTVWTIEDPMAGVSAGSHLYTTNGADYVIEMTVPAGADHDFYTDTKNTVVGPRSYRLQQGCTDVDWTITVKWVGTAPASQYQERGLFVKGGEFTGDRYIRYDNFYDGTTSRLFFGSLANGTFSTPDPNYDNATPPTGIGSPFWQRIVKSSTLGSGASTWSLQYSTDGASFNLFHDWQTTAGGTGVAQPLSATHVGIFCGNAWTNGGTDDAPAYTLQADYFFVEGAEIVPEDDVGGAPRRIFFIG